MRSSDGGFIRHLQKDITVHQCSRPDRSQHLSFSTITLATSANLLFLTICFGGGEEIAEQLVPIC